MSFIIFFLLRHDMNESESRTMAASNNQMALSLQKKTVNDFKFIKEIGNGSYATVRTKILYI